MEDLERQHRLGGGSFSKQEVLRETMVLLLVKLLLGGFLALLVFLLTVVIQINNFWTGFFILVVQILFSVYIVMSWGFEYYEINTLHVIHKRGILFIRKEIVSIRNIEKIELEQGLFGRLFDFGTIKLKGPTLEREIALHGIQAPEYHIELIEDIIRDFRENYLYRYNKTPIPA